MSTDKKNTPNPNTDKKVFNSPPKETMKNTNRGQQTDKYLLTPIEYYSIPFALNVNFENKELKKGFFENEYRRFYNTEGTLDNLKEYILKGYAVSYCNYKDNIRSKSNFTESYLFGIDYDQGFGTIDDLLKNEFIAKHGFIYTTASHTEDNHRCRVIYASKTPITDPELYSEIIRVLASKSNGKNDTQALDASRLWYGNTNAKFFNWKDKICCIPLEIEEVAKQNLIERKNKEAIELLENKKRAAAYSSELNITQAEKEEAIDNILRKLPSRQKGTGTYQIYLNLATAIKNELGYSIAVSKMASHSPDESWKTLLKSTRSQISFQGFISQAKKLGYVWDKNDFPWSGRSKKKVDNFWRSEEDSVVLDQEQSEDFSKVKLNHHSISKLVERAERLSNHEPFIYKKIEKKLHDNNVIFVQDRWSAIPYLKDYDEQNPVEVIFSEHIDPNEKAKYIQRLFTEGGWEHIHDSSIVGSGKSHMIKFFNNSIYLDKDYKNPSIEDIKNDFVELPARIGIGKHKHKRTGQVRIDIDFKKEHLEDWDLVEGQNCIRTEWFTTLAQKGYDLESGAVTSPCTGCPWNVADDDGKTYCDTKGYKAQKAEAFNKLYNSGKGRAYHAQLTKKYEKYFSDKVLIFEEASVSNDFTKTTIPIDKLTGLKMVVKGLDIDDGLKTVFNTLIERCAEIHFLKQRLYEDVGVEPESNKFYGFTDDIIRKYLYKDLDTNTDDLLGYLLGGQEPTLINTIVKAYNEFIAEDLSFLKGDEFTDKYKLKQLKGLEDSWVYTFLRGLCNLKAVFSTDNFYNLQVHHKNTHREKLTKLSRGNLYLDATASTTRISRLFSIVDPILSIQNNIPDMGNLNVIRVNTSGMGSKEISNKTIDKVTHLNESIRNLHPGKTVKTITNKNNIESFDTDYYFGVHDRGTNIFKDTDVLIFNGVSRRNVNDIKSAWYIDCPKREFDRFEEYYQELVHEDLIQGIGRLRAQHRPNDKLVCYVVDSKNIEFDVIQENFNCKLYYLESWQLDPTLADLNQKLAIALADVVNNPSLDFDGTQKYFAKLLSVTQGTMSKAFNKIINSVRYSKKLFLSLINNNKGKNILTSEQESLLTQLKDISKHIRELFEESLNVLQQIGAKASFLHTQLSKGFIRFTDEFVEVFTPSQLATWVDDGFLETYLDLIPADIVDGILFKISKKHPS